MEQKERKFYTASELHQVATHAHEAEEQAEAIRAGVRNTFEYLIRAANAAAKDCYFGYLSMGPCLLSRFIERKNFLQVFTEVARNLRQRGFEVNYDKEDFDGTFQISW